MSQHDYSIANQSGISLRGDISGMGEAIATNNSGTTPPTTSFEYQLFANETTGKMQIRDKTNPTTYYDLWTLGQNLSISTDGTLTGDGINTPLSITTPFTESDKNKLNSIPPIPTDDGNYITQVKNGAAFNLLVKDKIQNIFFDQCAVIPHSELYNSIIVNNIVYILYKSQNRLGLISYNPTNNVFKTIIANGTTHLKAELFYINGKFYVLLNHEGSNNSVQLNIREINTEGRLIQQDQTNQTDRLSWDSAVVVGTTIYLHQNKKFHRITTSPLNITGNYFSGITALRHSSAPPLKADSDSIYLVGQNSQDRTYAYRYSITSNVASETRLNLRPIDNKWTIINDIFYFIEPLGKQMVPMSISQFSNSISNVPQSDYITISSRNLNILRGDYKMLNDDENIYFITSTGVLKYNISTETTTGSAFDGVLQPTGFDNAHILGNKAFIATTISSTPIFIVHDMETNKTTSHCVEGTVDRLIPIDEKRFMAIDTTANKAHSYFNGQVLVP